METSWIGTLRTLVKHEIESHKIDAEKYELIMKSFSDKRDIFGRIKNLDDYEENHRWAYWHRAYICAYTIILNTVEKADEEYYDLKARYEDLEERYTKLEAEHKELKD